MLDIQEARRLINFAGKTLPKELGEEQLKATVSLYNMMLTNGGLGYLADEVGMGKTYIALGLISLMRYINPSLKVLYILPKQNVLDKWIDKEYPNFLKDNFRVQNHKVKSFENKPASPQVKCKNLIDLIKYSSVGYYGDFFIKMSSFSFPLSESEKDLRKKLKELNELIPSAKLNYDVSKRHEVKEQYAKTINKVLPYFDLIVIDEAHNFRKSMTSSDRNKYLSLILGTNEDSGVIKKVDNVLLLSATPYDRDITQLSNQLQMVGMDGYAHRLMSKLSKEEATDILKEFMVRRLNKLKIGDKEYTRNQYRIEKRDKAAIEIEQIDKKLIVALVQKKVGELLEEDTFKGQFQTGMLASFESYLPSSKRKKIKLEPEFDNTKDSEIKTAIDNNIITHLHDSYTKEFKTTSMPHPKMDSVVDEYSYDSFVNGKKHIIFVRRVQSVTDLKTKFDEQYDLWLIKYLNNEVKRNSLLTDSIKEYESINISKKSDVDNSDNENSANTFFTYFFRGTTKNTTGTPFDIKNRLNTVSKNDKLINTFEINWFYIFDQKIDISKLQELTSRYWREESNKYKNEKLTRNEKFHIVQICFLQLIGKKDMANYYRGLHSIEEVDEVNKIEIDSSELMTILTEETFFNYFEKLFEHCFFNDTNDMYKVDFTVALIASVLRLGHGIIDIYISYTNDPVKFLSNFINILKQQKKDNIKFSTYMQIKESIYNIDLIIRNNFSLYTQKDKSFTQYIGDILSPLEAIVGARGGSGNKSAIARKFRMPGYPMILISTDVLQEGEDLHTFCDSVIHYGLANSPIAIEQKNGRVDRIGSLAQRNLQSKKFMHDDDVLKVSFPFLKQSIEVVQIHNISHNMNDFIKSIDSFDKKSYSEHNTVDTVVTSIPQQITDKLESPFEAVVFEIEKDKLSTNLLKLIENDKLFIANIRSHIKILLDRFIYDTTPGIEAKIGIAKSSAELLLQVSKRSEVKIFSSKNDLLTYMKRHSYDIYHRTLAEVIRCTDDEIECKLSYDVQMIIGDDTLTQQEEVAEAFERINGKHLVDETIYDLKIIYDIANSKSLHSYGFTRNHEVYIEYELKDESIDMTFEFIQNGIKQEQIVNLYISNGYVVFESKVTEDKFVDELDMQKIIEYTWQRNNYIDLVEFVVDQNGAIIGRVVFPCKHIQNKEILYNAYVVACESDHLEHLLYYDAT